MLVLSSLGSPVDKRRAQSMAWGGLASSLVGLSAVKFLQA
jgi:hypothetical protein